MVSVGAGAVNQPLTRWLFNSLPGSAFYRSYREPGSREAMRNAGWMPRGTQSIPDLAFALPAPAHVPVTRRPWPLASWRTTGSNDEREQADEITLIYVDGMKRFVRWLVDHGRKVRLLIVRHERLRWPSWWTRFWPICGSTGPISTRPGDGPAVTSFADVMRGCSLQQCGRDPVP